jgi:hypothetical protein
MKTKTIRPHRKQSWTQDEVERYYTAAIIEQRTAEYLLSHSAKNRTLKSIHTKLYKEYGVLMRTNRNGDVHFYLADNVPNRIIRKRRQVSKKQLPEKATANTDVKKQLIKQLQAELNGLYQTIGIKQLELDELKTIASKWQKKIQEYQNESLRS